VQSRYDELDPADFQSEKARRSAAMLIEIARRARLGLPMKPTPLF